jgi:hypothetical protein
VIGHPEPKGPEAAFIAHDLAKSVRVGPASGAKISLKVKAEDGHAPEQKQACDHPDQPERQRISGFEEESVPGLGQAVERP